MVEEARRRKIFRYYIKLPCLGYRKHLHIKCSLSRSKAEVVVLWRCLVRCPLYSSPNRYLFIRIQPKQLSRGVKSRRRRSLFMLCTRAQFLLSFIQLTMVVVLGKGLEIDRYIYTYCRDRGQRGTEHQRRYSVQKHAI